MPDKIDIKAISKRIVKTAYNDLGYGELEEYIYNTLKEVYTKGYNKGAADKEEILRDIKQKQEQRINKKFNDLWDSITNSE